MNRERIPTRCYVDESIQTALGFVVTAFVFADSHFSGEVAAALTFAGLKPGTDEFKSSSRMASNPRMRSAREALLALAGRRSQVAVCVGPYERASLGKHSLQALQSTVVRNAIRPSRLTVHFDEDIFPSTREAARLHKLFHFLRSARIHARESSKRTLGIQVADAIAHSVGQIVKEELTGKPKLVDIGGPSTGYPPGTMAELGWHLLMTLRQALMTRPMVYNGERYSAAADPVVLDPLRDDPATYGQHPVLLGWGVQVAPEAGATLRQAVERAIGRIWLGCIH